MAVSDEDVLRALVALQDPERKQNLVSLNAIRDLRIEGGKVHFRLELTMPPGAARDQLRELARDVVKQLSGVSEVEVIMTSLVQKSPSTKRSPASSEAPRQALLPSVKYVIPVASGKGGVGKSTVSVNLALSLVRAGFRVGLLDADLYGPTLPTLLGIRQRPEVTEEGQIRPIEKHGLKVISMGFFLGEDEAVIWRGPLLHQTIRQFLGDVAWGELDYLLVDLPPGTGDVQLSLCQLISMSGAVIVSTPQDVALAVASKAIAMFQKLNSPILGIIENMSYFICPHCAAREDIFGSGGAQKAAKKLAISFLGEIPLAGSIRIHSDSGNPIVLSEPNSPISQAFFAATQKLVSGLGGVNQRKSKIF
ncbi:MAG: Mrp/NBP35 family ATP-binding protein [Candidatus Omnitrophota bacterium]